MKTILKLTVAATAALLAVSSPLAANAHGAGGGSGWHGSSGGHGAWGGQGGWGHRGGGHWRGGYWGPGRFWGGLGLGIGIGAIGYYGAYAPYGYGYGGYYAYPEYGVAPVGEYLVVDPPADRVVRSSGQPVPMARAADPIFYPKNGQAAAKTEADRQDCNRWATTQAGAMNDASIFQRATFACMEGRGYVVK
ncbi:MAG: hypothetical protein M3Z29_14350 [Pseudomonadota bacterium]|nr:hypothetical protein [Pseudomonadota bacterium]